MKITPAVILFAVIVTPVYAKESACLSRARTAANEAVAKVERSHNIKVPRMSWYYSVMDQIVSETCKALIQNPRHTAKEIAASTADRFFTSAAELGAAPEIASIVTHLVDGTGGLGRQKMTGVISAPCSGKTDSTYVVIEGKAVAKCGIRVMLPAEPRTIQLSRSGQIICQGMVQVDSEMEQTCGCLTSSGAEKPALSKVVCQSDAEK